MTENLPIPSVLAREAAIVEVYLKLILGQTRLQACEEAPFTRKALYQWEHRYPAWMAERRDQAQQMALAAYQAKATELMISKARAQQRLDEIILEHIEPIVRRLAEEAGEERTSVGARLEIAKTLASFERQGFFPPLPIQDQREQAHAPSVLVSLLEASRVTLPDGTPVVTQGNTEGPGQEDTALQTPE